MQGSFIISALTWELTFFIAMNVFWISLYFLFRKRSAVKGPIDYFVSIIIPVFNKGGFLRKSINSALNLAYKNKEIILVNDGSTDDSESICRDYERGGFVKFINFKQNHGKAHALNTGIKMAKGDLILTMDADSFINKNALNRMIEHFADKKVGAVAGVVRANKAGGILNRLQILEYFQQGFQRIIQGFFHAVLVLPGPISLYSREALAKSGGFEKDTLVEDWDMTLKVHKAGYGVISEKNAFADTIVPKKIGDWWRQRTRWSRGGIKIAKKHTNILHKSNTKALTRLIFPLHIMWLIVPFIVIPTMIWILIPSNMAIANVMAHMSLLLASIKDWVFAGAGLSIVDMYRVIDLIIVDFMDFSTFGWVRFLGYASGLAFLWFTYTSIRAFEPQFKPKHLVTVLLMPIYWLMLNAVYVYSLIIELSKGELKW